MDIPVFEDKFIEPIHYEPRTVEFRVFKDKCELYNKIRSSLRPIIEFQSGAKDMTLMSNTSESNKMWEAWIDQVPLKGDVAGGVLMMLSKSLDNRYTTLDDSVETQNWIRLTLENRLKFKGIRFSHYDFSTSIYSQELELDEEDDIDLDDFLLEINDELMTTSG